MDRKDFLKLSALLFPGLAIMPSLLSSCKKKTLFDGEGYSGKVIVVGAGISGLYAAYLLHLQGADVTILEASDRIGGRIRSLENFADFTIDLGADEIRGERSIWHDAVKASGATFRNNDVNDFYYFNGLLKTEAEATENTFFNAMEDLIASLPDYAGEDISALAWAEGLNDNIIHIFNARIGNKNGTSIDRIGMYGLLEQYERSTAGEEVNSLSNKDFYSILEERFDPVIGKTIFNSPVTSIDHTGSGVTLETAGGDTYTADKVIVTVPLNVLKNNVITFTPALENDRVAAMQKIGMDRGISIAIKFDERVWPENTGSIFGDGLVPEFRASGNGRGTDNVLTAFVYGPKADQLVALGSSMIDTVLGELDDLVGDDASLHYVDHHFFDWGNEPYIQGAFSYPPPMAGNAREILARTISDKVYFAGEATHTEGHFATVHGAMETGLRVVNEILEKA